MNRLFLARHGATEWSLNGRHTSHTDLPLLEEGRSGARQLGERLAGHEFALVLTSPLQRARETCTLAGFGEVAVVETNLHEWDYGDYEGLTTPEIRQQDPGWAVWQGSPNGETPEAVSLRADHVVQRARAASGDVLAFAHGHMLRVVAARWLGLAGTDGRHFVLGTSTLSVLGYDRESPAIERWNC